MMSDIEDSIRAVAGVPAAADSPSFLVSDVSGEVVVGWSRDAGGVETWTGSRGMILLARGCLRDGGWVDLAAGPIVEVVPGRDVAREPVEVLTAVLSLMQPGTFTVEVDGMPDLLGDQGGGCRGRVCSEPVASLLRALLTSGGRWSGRSCGARWWGHWSWDSLAAAC